MVFKWRDNNTDQFLNIYRSYEFLWNTADPLYKNRAEREAAYKKIVEQLKLPSLTVRDVKNKIKTIRTNYKYELNKVLRSQIDCTNPSDVYVPHLFWFKKADEFLRDFSIFKEMNNSKMDCSEDENSFIPSEDNGQLQTEFEESDIKVEDESMPEEEFSIESISPHNHSETPSPQSINFPVITEIPTANTQKPISTVICPKTSLTSSSDDTKTKGHSASVFKLPANVEKMNGRPYRRNGMINSNPKSRIDPLAQKRSRQLLKLEERLTSLQKSVDSLKNDKDDEFDLFGKSIALQLQKMPLERALICQENLQRVINQERLKQNK